MDSEERWKINGMDSKERWKINGTADVKLSDPVACPFQNGANKTFIPNKTKISLFFLDEN